MNVEKMSIVDKEIIDFALWLLSGTVTKSKNINEKDVIYRPKEWDLLKGNLIHQGENLLKQFRNDRTN